jgi:outer membrane receptor for ferrienterochelin and colicin
LQRALRQITPVRAAVCVALYGLSPGVHAQQANATAGPAEAATGTLQEVTVTATRRTQSLEAVPYSLSVVSGEQLAATGVTDLASLATEVPGLSMYQYGGRDASGWSSRTSC